MVFFSTVHSILKFLVHMIKKNSTKLQVYYSFRVIKML